MIMEIKKFNLFESKDDSIEEIKDLLQDLIDEEETKGELVEISKVYLDENYTILNNDVYYHTPVLGNNNFQNSIPGLKISLLMAWRVVGSSIESNLNLWKLIYEFKSRLDSNGYEYKVYIIPNSVTFLVKINETHD